MEKEALKYILKKIVDKPEDVKVDLIENETKNFLIIKFQVAKEDIGKIIGKQGRVIKTIRVFISEITKKTNKYVRLELIQ